MHYLLIGKPNVGKSSIYNILTASNKNIIHKEEGTTRDWHKSNIIMKIAQILLILGIFFVSYGYSIQMRPLCNNNDNNVRIIPMDDFNELLK